MERRHPTKASALAWLGLAAVALLVYFGVLAPLAVTPAWTDFHQRQALAIRERVLVAEIARAERIVHERPAPRTPRGDFLLPATTHNAASAALIQYLQSVAAASARMGVGCVSTSETPLPAPQEPSRSPLPYRSVAVGITLACGTTDLTGLLRRLEQGRPMVIVEGMDAFHQAVVVMPGAPARPLEAHLIVRGFWQSRGVSP